MSEEQSSGNEDHTPAQPQGISSYVQRQDFLTNFSKIRKVFIDVRESYVCTLT